MSGKKGKSGRKAQKSINLLKLTGAYRADRHAAQEVSLPVGIPKPPPHVKGVALTEWKRITKMLKLTNQITGVDRAALAAYCIEYAKYAEATEKLLKTDSMLVRSSKNTIMSNPLLRIADKAFNNMMKVCTEFGFTFASRRSLRVEPKIKINDEKAKFFEKNEA